MEPDKVSLVDVTVLVQEIIAGNIEPQNAVDIINSELRYAYRVGKNARRDA